MRLRFTSKAQKRFDRLEQHTRSLWAVGTPRILSWRRSSYRRFPSLNGRLSVDSLHRCGNSRDALCLLGRKLIDECRFACFLKKHKRSLSFANLGFGFGDHSQVFARFLPLDQAGYLLRTRKVFCLRERQCYVCKKSGTEVVVSQSLSKINQRRRHRSIQQDVGSRERSNQIVNLFVNSRLPFVRQFAGCA